MAKPDRLVSEIAKRRRTLTNKKISPNLLRTQATLEHLAERTKRLKKSDQEFSTQDLARLKRKTRANWTQRKYIELRQRLFRVGRFKSSSKFSAIKQTFGSQGEKLGVLLIKPEMFGIANQLRTALNSMGFEVIHVKNIRFDKNTIHTVYGDEYAKNYGFEVQGAHLMNGPSKLLVFRHIPREQLYARSTFLQELKKSNPQSYQEMIARLDRQSIPEVFATLIKGRFDTPLKGTLRKELVYPTFERLKFEGGGYLDSLLDSLGYFKSQQKKGRKESETYKFSGIHSISSLSELFLALNSFFSKKEIANISQLAKRK